MIEIVYRAPRDYDRDGLIDNAILMVKEFKRREERKAQWTTQ